MRNTRFTQLVLGLTALAAWCPDAFATWQQATTIPPWAPRDLHSSVVFDNKIWIFGGYGYSARCKYGNPDYPGRYRHYGRDYDNNGVWYSSNGVSWTNAPTSPPWIGIPVVFNGKIWAFGEDRTSHPTWHVWNSSDGLTWTEVGGTPPWAPDLWALVVYDGKIWVISTEYLNYDSRNIFWSSSDGVTWTQLRPPHFPSFTEDCTLTVHDGKMWVMGGYWGYDEAWCGKYVCSSSDGVNWTVASPEPPWRERHFHTAIEWRGRLWVIGGTNGYDVYSDIWSSADGVNWTQETSDTPIEPVYGHAAVVFRDRVWLLGGLGEHDLLLTSDLRSSTDGSQWTPETHGAPWGRRLAHASTVFHDKLWTIGGYSTPEAASTDIWSSPNGLDWSRVANGTECLPRYGHSVLVHNGKMWLLGGHSMGDYYLFSDVWNSDDGENWNQVTTDAPWGLRSGLASETFAGKMWVLGGVDISNHQVNDVWASVNGVTWIQVQPSAAWPARSPLGVVAFRDKLWLIGGANLSQDFNDVWSSSDGVTWSLVTASAPWKPRKEAECLAYDGKLWVVGGKCGYAYLNDVWCSQDGVTWTESSSAAPWFPRAEHTCAVFQGKLCLMAGRGPSTSAFNDVWTTTDGRAFDFTTLPSGGWIEEGKELSLRVEVSDTAGDVTYQWVKDGVKIDGATNQSFTIPALVPADQGAYSCFVTNSAGTEQQTPPANVQVFPENSLPVSHTPGLAVLLSALLMAGVRHSRKQQPLRRRPPSAGACT